MIVDWCVRADAAVTRTRAKDKRQQKEKGKREKLTSLRRAVVEGSGVCRSWVPGGKKRDADPQ